MAHRESQVKSRRKMLNPVFHKQTPNEDDRQLSPAMIKIVLKTGQLNLSGRGLANVPEKMFTMYDADNTNNQATVDLGRATEDAWWSQKTLTFLDLSSNVLQSIPAKIGVFEDITTLNLQDNSLTALPDELGRLTSLTKLNVSRNKLTSLPGSFYRLIELQSLNLSHNQLVELASGLGDLVMLQSLDISHNCLTNLPPDIGFCVRLTSINISHNQLLDIPTDISNLRAMSSLDITHNNLKLLPKLGDLRKLQTLYAQHNDIEELPDLEGCENLHELHFGNNFIKVVHGDFCESIAQHLKILDLRDNKIAKLPDEIGMLQNMIRLDLTNNDIQSLPNSLGFLPHLQNLQLEGNTLRNMRQDVIKAGTCRILKYIRDKTDHESLILHNLNTSNSSIFNEPSKFPDKYAMKNARALQLSMKELTNVPDSVFDDAITAEVQAVDLCRNKLPSVPQGLQKVAGEILELNLSQNLLKSVPDFLSTCNRLQYLELSKNSISELPESFDKLKNLREIVLSFNSFTSIPSCVYQMDNLEILLISDNKLSSIDIDNLELLKKLATLDLSNNNIDQIPPRLGNMKQIRSLELKGNCFRQPRYAILDQGTDSILSYLRDRIPV